MLGLVFCIFFVPLCAYLLRKPIETVPWLFYALTIAVTVLGLHLTMAPNPSPSLRAFAWVVHKGYAATILFALVMYIGALPRNSVLRRSFMRIRAELSIIASILICGHLLPYLENYLEVKSIVFVSRPSVTFSLLIAVVLLVLLTVLAVTSLRLVRKHMKPEKWKRIQRLAYLFFGLIYFHQLGYLLVPAIQGVPSAILSVALYSILFGGYALARIHRKASCQQIAAQLGESETIRGAQST